MALTEATLPAYFTAAWDEQGKLKIQQLQKRLVVYRDGNVISSQDLPIELIMAPHANDTVTPGLLGDALSAVASGQLLAMAAAQAEHEAAALEFEAKLTAKTKEAEDMKIITDQASTDATAAIAAKDAELAAKDVTIQQLMADHAAEIAAAHEETARLRVVVDAFPVTESLPD